MTKRGGEKKGLLYFTRHDFDGRDRSIRTGRTRAVPLEGVSDKQLHYLPVSPPVRRELRNTPRHANQPGDHFTFIREKGAVSKQRTSCQLKKEFDEQMKFNLEKAIWSIK